ncbi:MAG: ribosome-binding factor A [Patescibacteria group bacterium]
MSDRILKVNELLKQEAGAAIARELEMPHGVLATITRVDAQADLKTAKIFVRVYPEDHSAGALDYLRKNAGALQSALNHRLAMNFVPRISFYIDKGKEGVPTAEEEVEAILDSLK